MIKSIKEWRALNEYTLWVNKCMTRDGHRCTISWDIENLNVHHIIPLSKLVKDINNAPSHKKQEFIDRLWDINNGTTIEEWIHKEFHSKYNRRNFKAGEKEWNTFKTEWKLNNLCRREYVVKETIVEEFEGERCIPLLITEVTG